MTTPVDKLREKKREVARMLREAERLAGGESNHRDNRTRYARKKSASERACEIRDCADPARRARLEADPAAWLRFYLAEAFEQEFTANQLTIITDTLRTMREGGYQAIAAPRGDGKTTTVKGVLLYAIVTGMQDFIVVIGANATQAEESILNGIKSEIESNEVLAADYPEVCDPVRGLEGSAKRARMQTDGRNGKRTDFSWSTGGVVFPTVDGSKASGAVLRTRGADAAIRGLLHKNRRPGFVLIDDPDTEESAFSELQTRKRIGYIKRGVSRLGKGGRKIGVVMLTTIMARNSVSDIFTDPKREPAWNGRRFKLVTKWPERADLWDTYMRMRKADQEAGELTGPNATAFYSERRELMDAGAEVSNPTRFDPRSQLSALQACYDIIADDGEAAFLTECQNEPPEDDRQTDTGLAPHKVSGCVNGVVQRMMPGWAKVLTVGVDVGKFALHYVVGAWADGFTGAIVDYGIIDVIQPDVKGVDLALVQALRVLRDGLIQQPIVNSSGEPVRVNAGLVDSGWRDAAIHVFANETGLPWMAAKGFGESANQSPFHARKPTKLIQPGEHWYRERSDKGMLAGFDADWWKRRIHDQFAMEHHNEDGTVKRGSLTLYGDRPVDHKAFAEHICGEIQVQEFPKNKAPVWKWKRVKRDQHWLDALVMSAVGASICGINANQVQRVSQPSRPQPTRRVITGGWQGR